MKLPKKVIIGGREWKIKKDLKVGGANFDGGKSLITVGTKYPDDIPMAFIHEVLEAILTERSHRYKIYDTDTEGDMLFSFNHAEFCNISVDLALALKDML